MDHKQSHHHSGHDHSALIQELFYTALACETCMSACLEENATEMAHCIEIDRDCSEICFQAIKLLQRDSEFAHSFLAVCEEACRTCAKECSKHEDDHCKACAEACIKCAEACHAHHGELSMK